MCKHGLKHAIKYLTIAKSVFYDSADIMNKKVGFSNSTELEVTFFVA